MKRAVLVVNSHSRSGMRDVPVISAGLRQRGVELPECHIEQGHKRLRKRVRGAVKSGAGLIVVCGGDGSISAAVGEIANRKSVLGVVPTGTGNSFAASLGIRSLDEALDVIAYGDEARADVGCVNGIRFANFATLGLAADIGNRTPDWLKARFGPLAYGFAAIGPILRQKPFEATVRWKKHRLRIETRQIVIVCGRDFGHTPLTAETTPFNGMLTFFATSQNSTIDVVKLYAAFLANAQTELRGVHAFQAEKITIHTSRRVRVAVDGSNACRTPVTFSVEPRALRVMIPSHPAPDGA